MTADGYYVEPPWCAEHATAYEWQDGSELPDYAPGFRPLGWVCQCDPGHPDPHWDRDVRMWQDRHADLAATLRAVLARCTLGERQRGGSRWLAPEHPRSHRGRDRPAGTVNGDGEARSRSCYLATVDVARLDQACQPIRDAFDGHGPYLVGSALFRPDFRDVDLRVILPDDEFDVLFASENFWGLVCQAITAYLREATGLPVDFQVQRMTEANAKYPGAQGRHAYGFGSVRGYAGGGDATPFPRPSRPDAACPCGCPDASHDLPGVGCAFCPPSQCGTQLLWHAIDKAGTP